MYDVVILAEQAMTAGDAQEVVVLHEDIEDNRHYHVLIPCDNAADRVEQALGTLAASEMIASLPVLAETEDVEQVQQQIDESAQNAVTATVAALGAFGADATGEFSADDPIETLTRVVEAHQAAEVIVMTRPHVVAELLHLDWASKARRRLGVPILHLLEHEPLDAEAGTGQGITGM